MKTEILKNGEVRKYDERGRLVFESNPKYKEFIKYNNNCTIDYTIFWNGFVMFECYNDSEYYYKDIMGTEDYYCKYNEKHKIIYKEYSDGDKTWYEYDENGNCIHTKNSDGLEYWNEYDENNKIIRYRDSDGLDIRY